MTTTTWQEEVKRYFARCAPHEFEYDGKFICPDTNALFGVLGKDHLRGTRVYITEDDLPFVQELYEFFQSDVATEKLYTEVYMDWAFAFRTLGFTDADIPPHLDNTLKHMLQHLPYPHNPNAWWV